MKDFIWLICLLLLVLSCNTAKKELALADEISSQVFNNMTYDKREVIYNINFWKLDNQIVVRGETTLPHLKTALFAALNAKGLQIIDSVIVLPSSALNETNWALVSISVCNMKVEPGHSTEMASQAILGTPLLILKKQGSWILVQTPDQYIGWVESPGIFEIDLDGLENWRLADKVIYLPLEGTGFDPVTNIAVTDLVAGSILKKTGEKGTNIIAEMPDGRTLQIPKSDCMDFNTWKNRPLPQTAELVKTAKSLLGRPYLWGGTSTKGVDCSGFVKTVYFLNGIILARDASLQYRHGVKTEPSQGWQSLREGDLVFFGRPATPEKPARVGHVGMYITDSEYINSSGMVMIDSFDPARKNFSKSRSEKWVGAQTILTAVGTNGIVKVSEHPWY